MNHRYSWIRYLNLFALINYEVIYLFYLISKSRKNEENK